MYPLLVNAIAATASTLVDRWAQSHAAKASATSVPFQQLLDGASATKRSASAMVERLRSELLSSPEIRTAVDSSDPTRPISLRLSPDGTVSAQSPGQTAKAITLSSDTATLARSLASLLPANTSFSLGV